MASDWIWNHHSSCLIKTNRMVYKNYTKSEKGEYATPAILTQNFHNFWTNVERQVLSTNLEISFRDLSIGIKFCIKIFFIPNTELQPIWIIRLNVWNYCKKRLNRLDLIQLLYHSIHLLLCVHFDLIMHFLYCINLLNYSLIFNQN